MSFVYKGCQITMNNYGEVFKDFDRDFLDEIRLAVLDDTPIGEYIPKLIRDKNGANKLNQIRKALRAFVPVCMISTAVSPEVTEQLRVLHFNRGDAAVYQLRPYITPSSAELSSEQLKVLISAVASGADISGVNFCRVKNDLVEIIAAGLIKRYPMWLIAEADISQEFAKILIRAMQLGIDIHQFLVGTWTVSQVSYLLSQSGACDIGVLLENVNCNFSAEQLSVICSAYRDNVDWTLLCLKEQGGFPVFNEFQMDVIRRALIDDVLTDAIYDYNKSDMEMQDLYELEMSKRNNQ